MADHPREQAQGMLQKIQEHSPTSSQVLGLFTLLTAGGILLFLGGLTVTGIVITLLLLTPVFILFSPILVPAGFVLFLCTGGILAAIAAGVTTISVISWIYNYFKGRHPPGAEQIDYARMRLQDTAEQMKHKARDITGAIQSKVQEAAPGA